MNTEQQKDNRNRLINIACNIVIVVLCIVLFGQGVVFVQRLADYRTDYYTQEDTLRNQVRHKMYIALLDAVCRNEAKEIPVEGDMEQLYAVAHYYEQAMIYNAYVQSGDAQAAAPHYDRMKEYESRMGEYDFVAEEIQEILGFSE